MGGIKWLSFLLLLYSNMAFAQVQTGVAEGVVKEEESQSPLSGVIVQLIDAEGAVAAYTITDEEGVFHLVYDKAEMGWRLAFRSLGYRSFEQKLLALGSPIEVLLAIEAIQLRDVVVTAPDIVRRSDTLIYSVGKYADAQDRSLGDVLKKMPGIEVEESGQINYNGKPINKFYIEDSDFLEGRYGLATENMAHTDVRNVEVIENHQPIRLLQGVEYADQAALNIRLKDDAKLRWMGAAEGGIGFSPLLYDASVFAMRVLPKRYNMEMLKADNMGWNPKSQSVRFTQDDLFGEQDGGSLPGYINVGNVYTPLDDKRVRQGESLLFNSSSAFKLNSDYELKANLTYEGEKHNLDRATHINYLEPGIADYSESEAYATRNHSLSGQAALQANTPEMYLKNNPYFDIKQERTTSDIAAERHFRQKAEVPAFDITNDLQLAKRIGGRLFTLTSRNRFINTSPSLVVDDREQAITNRAFRSVSEATYGRKFGQYQIRGRAGLDVNYQRLQSELSEAAVDSYPLINNSSLRVLKPYLSADFIYENYRLRMSFSALFNYHNYSFKDLLEDKTKSHGYAFFTPLFMARYKFSARWEALLDIRYASTAPPKHIYYKGVIMNNYRSLSVGYPVSETSRERSASLSFRYRNPISSVFINGGAKYEWNTIMPMHAQLFSGDYILSTYHPAEYDYNTLRITGGISKGLGSGKINLGVDAGYQLTKSSSMQNAMVLPYRVNTLSATLKLKGTIKKWISLDYYFHYAYNKMNMDTVDTHKSFQNLKQKASISLFPLRQLEINIGGEHYYSLFDDRSSGRLILFDSHAKWAVTPKIDLSIAVTNVLDEREYRYAYYDGLSETINKHSIRPRNIVASVQVRF